MNNQRVILDGNQEIIPPEAVQETKRETLNVDEAIGQFKDYQRLCKELLTNEDYSKSKDKKGNWVRRKNKSAWRKLARAFQVTTRILDKEVIRDQETGRVIEATFLVEASLPSGRTEEGWGECSIWERGHEYDTVDNKGQVTCKGPCNGRKHFTKPDHDIPATAHTRAKNRAISDLIGAGEVSAEEIDGQKAISRSSGSDDIYPNIRVAMAEIRTRIKESGNRASDEEILRQAHILYEEGHIMEDILKEIQEERKQPPGD